MEKITTVKYKSTGGASLRNAAILSYELAEAMLDEYDDMWKLAFEEYLYNKANKNIAGKPLYNAQISGSFKANKK